MFNALSFYVDIQAVLSLCSSWRTTDILLESRDEVNQIVPIYESYLLSHTIIKLNLTRRDLTALMIKLLKESKWVFNSFRERNYSRIKEKFSYVSLDFEAKIKKRSPQSEIDRPYEFSWISIK
jgi:actin-related protein